MLRVLGMRIYFLFVLAGTLLWARSPAPTLTVNAAENRHPINPDVYGIVNYGLDSNFAEEIKLPNTRWGGDATTCYNWQVDSSNSGFDWYFMGGSGNSNPTSGAGPDTMIHTFQPAGTHPLLTIPIIPYINSTAVWTCSFPVSVYGPSSPPILMSIPTATTAVTASRARLTRTARAAPSSSTKTYTATTSITARNSSKTGSLTCC